MIFDLFHSVSDPEISGRRLGARKVIQNFLGQAQLAESLGMDTVWLAESHFSSETQKKTSVATIPEFRGEVGLNSDSFQWLHLLVNRTERINFGTAIHNVVGGSGGPIASADRANTLNFINQNFLDPPRIFRLGVAPGRFPYQNTPFGIVPRNLFERENWAACRKAIFLEALEIFLRLTNGEELSSRHLTAHYISGDDGKPILLESRWKFEALKLTPFVPPNESFKIVLGSADPDALGIALTFGDVDLFNLSFTPPDQIEKLHHEMEQRHQNAARRWERSRLPRTVMVFIDPSGKNAHAKADFVLDTYIEAMRGTAATPEKTVLLERALVGDASEIRDQLHPDNSRHFHPEDRLMLWFEFNQADSDAISNQMRYFFEDVVAKL